ncbi:MAG: hypothetical protein WEB19_04165, partial [Acidimicrobiia bacterium]
VNAGEYVYSLKGSPKSGNVQIDFNNGGVEYHMMSMVKLKPGVTNAQLKKAALSSSNAAFKKIADGDGTVAPEPGILGPNTKMSMIAQLKAGHYGIVCFIPAASDGKPHVAHGMFKVFDVSSAKSNLTPPTDGVVDITLTDTAVTLPSTGIPAKGYAKIVNNGTTARDFNLAILNGTTTVAQADAYFTQLFESGPPAGVPPAVIDGGIIAIPKGGTAYLALDFAKGRYAYASSNSELEDDPNEIFAEFEVK